MPIEMPKGLPFSVDTWSPSSKRKRHHFLTHAHKDHCTGISLYSSYPIYSTHITKTLTLQQFPQLDGSLFVGIEDGESVVIDDPDGIFSVMAFNANHCPGAVMFLFQGNFGNILHTGDCRLTSEYVQNLPEKYIGNKGREPKCQLDYVFLDCTFGKFPLKFPSKHSAIRQVINCIWKHPNTPLVYLACDLLGQEEILMEVSRTFGSKIYVNKDTSSECFHALTLAAPDILSQDASSRFQVFEGFPRLYERAQVKLMEAQANFQPEPLIIRPSAQWYACENEHSELKRPKKPRFKEAVRDSFGVWHVCYSMHSSREELEWALQLLRPKRVVSTTPSCRAMELDYVKNHCFGAQVLSDDPIWELLDINTDLGSISPQASSFSVAPLEDVSSSVVDVSMLSFPEPNQLQLKHSSTNSIELRLNLSPPSTRPPITLFGRARLNLQESNLFHEEKRTVLIKIDPPPIVASEKEELSLLDVGGVDVQSEKMEESEIKVGKSVFDLHIGSSDSLDASLRKVYRSMNVPVPRPLPSLVELMNATRRVKRRLQL